MQYNVEDSEDNELIGFFVYVFVCVNLLLLFRWNDDEGIFVDYSYLFYYNCFLTIGPVGWSRQCGRRTRRRGLPRDLRTCSSL